MKKKILDFIEKIFGPKPWPVGAKSVEIEAKTTVVVRSEKDGPLHQLLPGKYTLLQFPGGYVVKDAAHGLYAPMQQWEKLVNHKFVKVL